MKEDSNLKPIVGKVLSTPLSESKSTLLRDLPMQVSPQWAEQAMCVTSTSLEISLDQLRNLYYKTFVGPDCEGSVNYDEKNGITITFKPKLSGDVDAKSINDQDEMKKYWENQIASGEIRILPPEPESKEYIPFDYSKFVSQVETPSIADIHQVKQHWEKFALEIEMEKEKSSRNNKKDKVQKSDKRKESAMEREIRLAEERDKQLQNELQLRSDCSDQASVDLEDEKKDNSDYEKEKECIETGHRKDSYQSISSLDQLDGNSIDEFDNDSRLSPISDTCIEKDIKIQMEREKELQSILPTTNSIDKEYEQSEYERKEKERERISAHESHVERDIRVTFEREKELEKQRRLTRSTPNLTDIHAEDSINENLSIFDEQKNTLENSIQFAASVDPVQNNLDSEMSKVRIGQEVESYSTNYENVVPAELNIRESVIAREMREQRERENELRKRWNDMGLKSPIDPDEHSDTPFNRPNIVPPKYITNNKPANNQSKSNSAKPLAENKNQYDEIRTSSTRSIETPIEREIRLARERENDLRKSKGLDTLLTSSADEISLEVKGEMHPVKSARMNKVSAETVNMRRLTTQRFQKEMEKSKEKEEGLVNDGTIKSTSEQSVGPSVRYSEVIRNEKHGNYKPLLPNRTYQTNLSSKLAAVPHSVSSSTLSINDERSYEPVKPISKSASHMSIPNGIVNQEPVSRLSAPGPIKGSRSMDFIKKTSSNNTESKIEQELREQRERENDLRRQRHGASSELELNLNEEESSSLELPRPNFASFKENENPKARRKSALAAEWERKFVVRK